MKQMYKYDIAISYASNSRKIVKEVVEYLKSDGFTIFFDVDRKEELLSEKLKNKLYQIYQNESLLKVLFVTKEYMRSPYTQLEARSALRSVGDNSRRLIVINFVGKYIPETLKNYVYLEGSNYTDEIAYLISKRIMELKKYNQGYEAEKENTFRRFQNINIVGTNHGIIAGNDTQLKHIYFK